MKRCWLHIGMHKTGSTSVQANLASVVDPPGWRYIALGAGPNMSQTLHAMFSAEAHKYHLFVKQGRSEEYVAKRRKQLRARFARSIRRCRKENIIVSGEALSLVDKAGIIELREFLKPLCDEVRIIGYVRPPASFMVSAYQQKVKHGNGKFNVAEIKPRYIKRFRKFDEVFGRENVILRKFDPKSFPNQCIVADFCQQVGIQLPASTSIQRTNESLSTEACGILYAYRKFGPGYGVGELVIKENARIIEPLLAMSGSKFKIAASVLRPGLLEDKKEIAWMEKRLGASLAESATEDESGISSEEELLRITGASCEEFAAKFREIHGTAIPPERIPKGDLVDPREVAEMVQCARMICREALVREKAAQDRDGGSGGGFLRNLIQRIKQSFAGTSDADRRKHI